MNKKIHEGEKNEIEYKGGRRQARREKGREGGEVGVRQVSLRGRGREMTKEGSFGEKLCCSAALSPG